MPRKRPSKVPQPSRADRAAKEVEYRAWKVRALADLANRHDAKAGIIPERLWRRLYIQGRSPHDAADQAATSAYNTMSPADRLKRLKR
jgi:hypothetical protein